MPWSAWIHTRFHVSGATQDTTRSASIFEYVAITLFGPTFQTVFLIEAFRSLLRPSSPDDAKASIICCNWFMQTHSILGVYFTLLQLHAVCLNFQRTKFIAAISPMTAAIPPTHRSSLAA